MSIPGLGTYNNSSYFFAAVSKGRGVGDLGNDFSFSGLLARDNSETTELAPREKTLPSTPYTRIITANIKTEEMTATIAANGEMIYSYSASEQSFQICIESDGENKTYKITGIDKDGNPFEREFDPYEVDPENADLPEFSALCMYIQQTDETADLLADDYFKTDDILEKRNYFGLLGNFANTSIFDRVQSMLDCANRLLDEIGRIMDVRAGIESVIGPMRFQLLTLDIENTAEEDLPVIPEKVSEALSSEKIASDDEELEEELTPLGIGFANAGMMGYGMSASLVTTPGSDDVIIRVNVAKGGGNSESIDVNLSEFDPKNATAVEMFAYCEYKDACGQGIKGHMGGSWSALKSIVSPMDGMDFGSLDNIMNKKMNWTKALSESDTSLEKVRTGEKITAADLLALFEENNKMTSQDLKDSDDWRTMSDEAWDKMLEGIDKFIEAFRERLREMIRQQQEAALKAAAEAPSELKSVAASQAALDVAANGFFGATTSETEEDTEAEAIVGEDPGVDHENNWTKKLKTNDQTILRTAKAAQEMENTAKNKVSEMVEETTTSGSDTEVQNSVNRRVVRGIRQKEDGSYEFIYVEGKPTFVNEEIDYRDFERSWMSQGANVDFTYRNNTGLDTVNNSISLVPGMKAKMNNGFTLSINNSMVNASGDDRDHENALHSAEVASAVNALIKVANGQIPINLFYSSRNQDNSELAREGLAAFGIDIDRPFTVNNTRFAFDEIGRLSRL